MVAMAAREINRETTMDLRDKKAVVVGLGKTGTSAVRFLLAKGAKVVVTERKTEEEVLKSGVLLGELRSKGVTIELGGHTSESFEGADLVVVSPGVPLNTPEIEKAINSGIQVVSDIEFASCFISAPIIAVVGTNGKSTVTEFLGEVLKGAGKEVFVGGNIGVPAIECAECEERSTSEGVPEFCVLEVSSFHLEAVCSFRPHVAMLLNITEDHLDRYADFKEYAETKFRVFDNQESGDFAIINAGDEVITEDLGKLRGSVIPFSVKNELDEGLFLRGSEIVFKQKDSQETYPTEILKIKGIQNIENAMAVIAAARSLGISKDSVLEVMKTFTGLPHRMEFVREVDGVSYFNDSKSTNIGSLKKALEGQVDSLVLIAGGRDKGGDYKDLRDVVSEKVSELILIGEAGDKIEAALGDVVKVTRAETLEEAINFAKEASTSGGTVLLSPACSSFDIFKGFEERGEEFKRRVEAL